MAKKLIKYLLLEKLIEVNGNAQNVEKQNTKNTIIRQKDERNKRISKNLYKLS